MATPRLCSVEDCGNVARPRGLCEKHYQRWRKYGDATFLKTAERGKPLDYFLNVVVPYKGDECLIWPYADNGNGYGRINMGEYGNQYVHRMSCIMAHGPAPTPEHEAAHSCKRGREGCVAGSHISWKTHAGNMSDQIVHGTKAFGSQTNAARLMEDDVRVIRTLFATQSAKEIAAAYGVVVHTIRDIRRGKTWGWLD